MWTLQVIESYPTEDDADEALEGLEAMPGCLGATVTCSADGLFCVHGFFGANQPNPYRVDVKMNNLPDGAKHVFVPEILQRWYGFKEVE